MDRASAESGGRAGQRPRGGNVLGVLGEEQDASVATEEGTGESGRDGVRSHRP